MIRNAVSAVIRGSALQAKITPQLLEAVGKSYDIRNLEVVEDLGGSANLNLLIEAADDRWVVRVYRPCDVGPGRSHPVRSAASRQRRHPVPTAIEHE
jgi:hypothetical protein